MADPDVTPAESKPPRSRALRLSVRALMVVVLVVCLALGYLVQRAQVQRNAVIAIEKTGGKVYYDWEKRPTGGVKLDGEPQWPKWMVRWLGVDYLGNVVRVQLGKKATDAEMEHVGRLPKLIGLNAPDVPGITDAGAAHLAGLVDLDHVSLSATKATGAALANLRGKTKLTGLMLVGLPIGDADLAQIAGLTNLEVLDLTSTKVGDAGLAHLAGLVNIKQLRLGGTLVEGTGLASLKGMDKLFHLRLEKSRIRDLTTLPPLPALKTLQLDETPVDDAILAQLPQLPVIQTLSLMRTEVTDAGLVALLKQKESLNGLRLSGPKITDAASATIAQLEKLSYLDLAGTKITDATLDQVANLKGLTIISLERTDTTDAGIARLRKALPKLRTTQEVMAAGRARLQAQNQPAAKNQTKPPAARP